jgi:hypothetical protein
VRNFLRRDMRVSKEEQIFVGGQLRRRGKGLKRKSYVLQ